MNTFWLGSPTTPTVVEDVTVGDVINHRGCLWRVTDIVSNNTLVALHTFRYRGRARRVITVKPGSKVAVVDGATRKDTR